jgi:hypothetical protein
VSLLFVVEAHGNERRDPVERGDPNELPKLQSSSLAAKTAGRKSLDLQRVAKKKRSLLPRTKTALRSIGSPPGEVRGDPSHPAGAVARASLAFQPVGRRSNSRAGTFHCFL